MLILCMILHPTLNQLRRWCGDKIVKVALLKLPAFNELIYIKRCLSTLKRPLYLFLGIFITATVFISNRYLFRFPCKFHSNYIRISFFNPVVAKNVSDKQASPSIANGIRVIERCREDLIISGIHEKRRNIAEANGWSREKAFFRSSIM